MNYEVFLHIIGLFLGCFLGFRVILGRRFNWIDLSCFGMALIITGIQYWFFD